MPADAAACGPVTKDQMSSGRWQPNTTLEREKPFNIYIYLQRKKCIPNTMKLCNFVGKTNIVLDIVCFATMQFCNVILMIDYVFNTCWKRIVCWFWLYLQHALERTGMNIFGSACIVILTIFSTLAGKVLYSLLMYLYCNLLENYCILDYIFNTCWIGIVFLTMFSTHAGKVLYFQYCIVFLTIFSTLAGKIL